MDASMAFSSAAWFEKAKNAFIAFLTALGLGCLLAVFGM